MESRACIDDVCRSCGDVSNVGVSDSDVGLHGALGWTVVNTGHSDVVLRRPARGRCARLSPRPGVTPRRRHSGVHWYCRRVDALRPAGVQTRPSRRHAGLAAQFN